MLGRITGAVRFKEPLGYHTSLRIGGPAEFLVVPQDIDDIRHALAFAHQEDLPIVVIGGGNNLLIADAGVQAVVLKLQGVLGRVRFDGDDAVAGAGVTLSALIREAAAHGLGGLEHLVGIPATVGGALAMNVSTSGGSLGELCSAVYFLYLDGTLGELRPTATHPVPELPAGSVVVGCRLKLVRRDPHETQKKIQRWLKQKKATQPFALASVGYVWKNPSTAPAERLIQDAGLRGKGVNGAEVSMKCGNFIINRGGARAADVLAVMDLVADTVERKFGVTLQPEIQLLGFDASYAERRELIGAR